MHALGVDRRRCQEHVNELRAEVGIAHEPLERALLAKRAQRAAFATALPWPRGWPWGLAGWTRDFAHATRDHAFFSGCMAYLYDPDFFERPAWSSELLSLMTPRTTRVDSSALAGVLAGTAVVATVRGGVRSIAERWSGTWWLGASLRLGVALAWGRAETALASRSVIAGLREHVRAIREHDGEQHEGQARIYAFPALAR